MAGANSPIPLTIGSYMAASLIASAQRCVNLYAEANPKDAPFPFTFYPTPGLTLLMNAPDGSSPGTGGGDPPVGSTLGELPVRGLRMASSGDLYGVFGSDIYYISPSWTPIFIGRIAAKSTPVSMTDNGIELIIVDGSPLGWYSVNLASRAFTWLSDPAFLGADSVDYTDTFLVFNQPGTRNFYTSLSNTVTPLDPTYIAAKTSRSDLLARVAVMHREIWLLGERTSECWFNAGAAQFPFQILNGIFLHHGCAAKYSVCQHDLQLFFLAQDAEGQAYVATIAGYAFKRISTHAIEEAIRQYDVQSDAIGMMYQQRGHVFYMLTFPTADKTWVYDLTTDQWHERTWIDSDGIEHRHRANCFVNAYGKTICGDFQNGKLYEVSLDNYTDFDGPIVRRKGFPHLTGSGWRFDYSAFIANIEPGSTPSDVDPLVTLRWSDTRGISWNEGLLQSIGALGEYDTAPTWGGGLGIARDRVFELSWSLPSRIGLMGAFVEGGQLRG